MRRGRLLALALAGLFSVVLLAGSEVVLSVAGWRERSADFSFRGNFPGGARHRRHPQRYYTTAPHVRSFPRHAGRFATGKWPFRGRPPEPAPADIRRVFVLGDSCVYGEGVDVNASLPQQIQVELEALGYRPCDIQVLNLGVIGYSTIQMRLCLEEALQRWRPDALVLYPAAWNDQAPHMGRDDMQILGQRPPLLARMLPATFHALRSVVTREPEPQSLEDYREFLETWERGDWPYGRRVSTERLGLEVERMLDLGEAAGAPTVVVLPPHRASTEERCPETVSDRELVRAVAGAGGAVLVDGPVLFAASGWSDGRLFVDMVHPSRDGHRLLASATAAALARILPPSRTEHAGAPGIRAVEPAVLSCLGDQRLRVALEGWDGRELPTVLVGGAPLLDLERSGVDAVTGITMQNGPGRRELVVQTSAGCAVGEILLEPPSIELLRDGDALVVRARSRPGDVVRVLVSSERREEPNWKKGWAYSLEKPRFLGTEIVCGPDGTGVQEIAPSQLRKTAYLQAIVRVPTDGDELVTAYFTDLVAWSGGE